MTPDDARSTDGLPANAAVLGYAGLLPFIAGALGTVALDDLDQAEWAGRLLVLYGAVILSFLGGVHWGVALAPNATRQKRLLVMGVVPSLVGWGSLALPYDQSLVVQIAGFGFFWLYENRALGERVLPRAYLDLRRRLTAVACSSLAIALIGSSDLS